MEQRFTEQQVADILRRAAEAQSRLATSPSRDPAGITADELTKIGRELGIDAHALAQAMHGVGNYRSSDTGHLGSTSRVLERTIPGEVTEDALALVLEDLVPAGGAAGGPMQVGRSLTYGPTRAWLSATSPWRLGTAARCCVFALALDSPEYLPTFRRFCFRSLCLRELEPGWMRVRPSRRRSSSA